MILKSHIEYYKKLDQIDLLSGTGRVLDNHIVADRAALRILNWVLDDTDRGGISE